MHESNNAATICCLPLEITGTVGLRPAAPAINDALSIFHSETPQEKVPKIAGSIWEKFFSLFH